MDRGTDEVTIVLRAAAAGDSQAAIDLLPLVYEELRRLARSRMGHLEPGQTLQPTALVHEAYMKVIGEADPGWDGRGHFFAAAANAMRQIIVDQARRKSSRKRGGDKQRVEMEPDTPVILPPADDVLALEDALVALEAHAPRQARVVTMRYYAGLTMDESAAALEVSLGTVERDWRYAKVWLHDRLSEQPPPSESAHA